MCDDSRQLLPPLQSWFSSVLLGMGTAQAFIMEWPEAICGYVVSTVPEAPGPAVWSQVRSRGWGLLTEPWASSRAHPAFPDTAH